MKIIDTQCEQKLKDILSIIKKEPTLWRCIYIEKTEKSTEIADKLRLELVTLIKDKHSSFLFNLPENELIFFSKGGEYGLLEEIIKKINSVAESLFIKVFPEIIDTSLDIEKLEAREKYYTERLKQVKQKKASLAASQNNVKGLHVEEDPQLIAQLKHTREEHEKLTIMLLDDDKITLKMVSSALKEYRVFSMESPQKALNEYFALAPHIVFLDINMPPYSGHEVLKKITSLDKDAFVIMLSANAYPTDIKKVMENGAKGFVGKPFSRNKLLNYVEVYKKSYLHK